MKTLIRQPLLKVACVALSLVLLFSFANGLHEKQVEQRQTSSITQQETQGLPVRLIIPSINVNAGIQYVGVTPQGAMEVPSNTVDVGWFKLGSHPGEKGSAVISGHFDGKNGEAGVFTNLYKLKIGDKLYIEDSNGKSITFVVRQSRTYDPGYADEVFSLNDSAHLNLVTCDGTWDGIKKSYSKRLVVFTDALW